MTEFSVSVILGHSVDKPCCSFIYYTSTKIPKNIAKVKY